MIELKRGATILDLAYAIHTDVGHHSVYAHVDRVRAPLNQVLRNGQTIQVHTDTQSVPSATWLEFAYTAKAKTAIKQYLRDKKILSERKIGRQILSAGLKIRGIEGKQDKSMFADIADEHELETGERREGIIFSARSFANKATASAGLVFGGVLLDYIDFPRGAVTGEVSEEIVWQLGFIAGPATSIFTILGVLLFFRYKIDRARHREIIGLLRVGKRSN